VIGGSIYIHISGNRMSKFTDLYFDKLIKDAAHPPIHFHSTLLDQVFVGKYSCEDNIQGAKLTLLSYDSDKEQGEFNIEIARGRTKLPFSAVVGPLCRELYILTITLERNGWLICRTMYFIQEQNW